MRVCMWGCWFAAGFGAVEVTSIAEQALEQMTDIAGPFTATDPDVMRNQTRQISYHQQQQ